MNWIVFPIKLRMRGGNVADLQDGLRLLLDKGLFQVTASQTTAGEG